MWRWGLAGLVAVALGCSSAGRTGSLDTLPLDDSPSADQTGGSADDLAPSQITASTVARPSIPDPCDVADLSMWTAQVASGSATIRIRNDGSTWCAVDVVESAALDPIAEQDLWLEPDDWADLVAGPRDDSCGEPSTVDSIEFDVNGETVVVTTALETCGWWITALYPVVGAQQPCAADALTGTWVEADRALVVGNVSWSSCDLAIVDDRGAAGSIVRLAAGDVAAWASTDVDPATCDEGPTLPFGQAVDISSVPPCTAFAGPGRPVVEVAPSLATAWADGSLDPFAPST
ncbi:MAG: hypothetical protein ABIP17_02260 [Ilumatobacteraceae bacterium]